MISCSRCFLDAVAKLRVRQALLLTFIFQRINQLFGFVSASSQTISSGSERRYQTHKIFHHVLFIINNRVGDFNFTPFQIHPG
jgi:hypothetical protein